MANYGIKIATDSGDIDSTSLKDYEFWTKYPMIKVKKAGSSSVSLTISGGSGSFSVEIDDDPTTFDPIIFLKSDVYDAIADSVVEDIDIPFRNSSSTFLISSTYTIERDSGSLYYRGAVEGASDGTYSLDYEYIILYDKFNG